jgi:hypothetical protein
MSILVVWTEDGQGWRQRVHDCISDAARRDSAPIPYALRGDWREGSRRAVKIETPTYRDAFLIAGGFVRGRITQA